MSCLNSEKTAALKSYRILQPCRDKGFIGFPDVGRFPAIELYGNPPIAAEASADAVGGGGVSRTGPVVAYRSFFLFTRFPCSL